MAEFSEVVSMLNACENDAQRLSFILDDIYDVNRVNEEERIPVFVGTIAERKTQAGALVNYIAGITTIWGTKLAINPYANGKLRAIIKPNKSVPAVGSRVVFVALFGSPNYRSDLLAGGTIRSYAQLEVDDDCSFAELANSILRRDEFAEFRTEVVNLLKVKEEYSFIHETVEQLQRKADELSQQLTSLEEKQQRLAPEGIEAANSHLDDLERRIQSGIISTVDLIGDGSIEARIQTTELKLTEIQQRTEQLAPDGIAAREAELDQLQARYDNLSGLESRIEDIRRKAKYFVGIQQMPPQDSPLTLLPTDESNPIEEFSLRLEYKYDRKLVLSFLTALSTTQIITLFGTPGTGKTTFISKMAKALGARCTIISVQNNWTDSADILGYYSPIDKTYESTPFVDALITANREWLQQGLDSRLHIICLDEMNLARVEYYFAVFLGLLQLEAHERWIRVLPKHIQEELDKLSEGETISEDKKYLLTLQEYADFILPPNVRFVGTINSDDTTNILSPKVIDRAYFIELSKEQRAPEQSVDAVTGYYPLKYFEIDDAPESKTLDPFKTENNRFLSYAKTMLVMYRDRLRAGKAAKSFCEQIIIAKVLPALRKASDYSYDATQFPEAHAAFDRHRHDNRDAYNYLGGNS